jgi:hypothetical protein
MARYGPPCSVCKRPDRPAVDELLIGGFAAGKINFRDFDLKLSKNPAIAQRFNIPKDTVARHAHACLGLTMSKQLVDSARKRNERNSMMRVLNAAIAPRDIPLRNRDDYRVLHQERYAQIDMIFLEAVAVGDKRIALAADEARGRILADSARIDGIDKSAGVVVDARSINIMGASADFMREYVRAVRAGDPVPAFPAAATIEGELVA